MRTRLRSVVDAILGRVPGIDLLEELIRIVNKAQERDAQDERRLYDPMLRDRLAEGE